MTLTTLYQGICLNHLSIVYQLLLICLHIFLTAILEWAFPLINKNNSDFLLLFYSGLSVSKACNLLRVQADGPRAPLTVTNWAFNFCHDLVISEGINNSERWWSLRRTQYTERDVADKDIDPSGCITRNTGAKLREWSTLYRPIPFRLLFWVTQLKNGTDDPALQRSRKY